MRTGWRSRCKIRRLRSSEVLIRFLTAEGEKPAAIHRRMVTVYGEKCVSDKSVKKWSARIRAGHESVGDDQRPGQVNTVITSDLIDKVDDLVRSDRHVTLRMLALKVDVSYGIVWTIIHDRLRFRKDTGKDWVSSEPQEFWEQGILWLVHQWDLCAQAYGVYFE
ncbi:HTH_48 domain-containing protein [Trichonephila inaurata madagascariensis]|uniref:HTH_48 domain-containing protein n=1 Tax=Trichonephila inaurata madagascariensis TaxID=2747483 RepID=A0A8X6IA99_9ARAC|nr:HTH_48 domain-containing protein [Trichonephila inaurata madagascariensis]